MPAGNEAPGGIAPCGSITIAAEPVCGIVLGDADADAPGEGGVDGTDWLGDGSALVLADPLGELDGL